MNTSRRDFLKKAAILSGAAGMTSVLPTAIQRALAIQAAPGTTFYDAEHIVFLMQENRSFDHLFGMMKGVRGFNDPRAKVLPGGNKVWIQYDKEGHAFVPFHIDIHQTKVTWQGGLPHGWPDQGNARNHGKYDRWIPEKTHMALGHYDRGDVPFYYALADAFTICDHYFCSSLTGTTPNRLFYWTGNIRSGLTAEGHPAIHNSMAESRDNAFVDWTTFPELLEDAGISWKIYQNELWTPNLPGKGVDYWLGNYGDNSIEYVSRHRVKLSAYFRKHGDHTVDPPLSAEEVQARYDRLSQREKNLVDKAFQTNIDPDGDYLRLEPFTFTDDHGQQQTIDIPRNDIFRQFRSDVEQGKLPTVSWLAAPQAFSDHTSTPLYGTWYVSEVLDILTKNPEVWKKTIFILNYDENDGYFDHLPPFTVPDPRRTDCGKVTEGIDVASDFEWEWGVPIGLGYRVPMIVASPWSKGGYVNSQVFDHTSTLMFLERFLARKAGKSLHVENISSWRRAICGDLTSVFRPYNGEQYPLPEFLRREEVITDIQRAKTRPPQVVPPPLSASQLQRINDEALPVATAGLLPMQESGTRPACTLPYVLYADAWLQDGQWLRIRMRAGKDAGAPFQGYAVGSYQGEPSYTWDYAVAADNELVDQLVLNKFEGLIYDLHLHGPNGFFRKFVGDVYDPQLVVECEYSSNPGISVYLHNNGQQPIEVELRHRVYDKQPPARVRIGARRDHVWQIGLSESRGWYDIELAIPGTTWLRQYAGHVEYGPESITDPYMGGEF